MSDSVKKNTHSNDIVSLVVDATSGVVNDVLPSDAWILS